jgi:hypothetical protein
VSKVAPILTGRRPVEYLGDLDHCGGQIEQANQRTLADQGCRWPHWHRVALTAEQLEQYDLPIINKPDRRYRPIRYFDAVESEALGQARIVAALTARSTSRCPSRSAMFLNASSGSAPRWPTSSGSCGTERWCRCCPVGKGKQ